jgi:hypothetical protein
MESWRNLITSKAVADKYELYNFNNALEIMAQAYTQEYLELMNALEQFTITVEDIMAPGGNESTIPKKIADLLVNRGWEEEVKITADLLVKLHAQNPQEFTIENYIDGHKMDYFKGKIAVDMEWNSKDQTFDRDLLAFRAYYECGIIDCGVIITRSAALNPVFSQLGDSIKKKYGASTTWMGKLLPRIKSRRHGGCPLFIAGITPNAIVDWEE